jgi:hypothetical protein
MTVFLKDIDPNSYSILFIQNLNYPFGIWEKAIKSQISEGSRFTLFILLSIGGPILLSDFKKVILQFNEISNKRGISFKVFDSKIYLKELEDSFIKIDITNSRNHFLNFQNPSVKDFLLEIVRNDKELILLLLSSISFFNQLVYIINYLIDNYRQDSEIRESIKNIIVEKFESFISSSYIFSNNLEVNRKTAIIEKLTSLIPYLKITSDVELINFVIDKFYLIEIKSLSHYQEKQYIGFIKEFPDIIEYEYKELINNVFSNISWLENISNFLSLRELDGVYFDEFIKSKKDEVKERIEITFEKEREYSDTPELLNDLASDISELRESIEDVSAIDFTYYDRAINKKINEINTIKEEEEEEKEEIEIDDYERDFTGENYNVDELFKEELFI